MYSCIGFINRFLSWGFFAPLSRMTFMVYLTHVGLIFSWYYSLNYSVELTDIVMVYYYIGLLMIAFGVGYVGTIALEMPFDQAERLFFKRKVRFESENEAKNGISLSVASDKSEEGGDGSDSAAESAEKDSRRTSLSSSSSSSSAQEIITRESLENAENGLESTKL